MPKFSTNHVICGRIKENVRNFWKGQNEKKTSKNFIFIRISIKNTFRSKNQSEPPNKTCSILVRFNFFYFENIMRFSANECSYAPITPGSSQILLHDHIYFRYLFRTIALQQRYETVINNISIWINNEPDKKLPYLTPISNR